MADSFVVPCSMKALVKEEAGESYSLVTVPVPEPRGGDVLVRVDVVAICGSDINLYSWNDVAKVIASIPFTPGHECTGVVVKRGEDVTIPIGQRIAVENHFFCGFCHQCMHGRGDICQNMGQFGHGRKTPHGGCSQYTLVPAKYCYALTTAIREYIVKDVSDSQAQL